MPLMALVHVVLGLLEVVAHELERARLVEVLDGENRFEDALQAGVVALLWRDVRLEKLVVARFLDGDEIGNFGDLVDLSEGTPNPEIVLNGQRHTWSVLSASAARPPEIARAGSLAGEPPRLRPRRPGSLRLMIGRGSR
jgi:hypothetical protein